MDTIDRIKGCMIGGAAGDALGYAVEFLSNKEIQKQYGEDGISDYVLTNGKAQVSDDTQMSLFTAMGLINTKSDDIDDYRSNIYRSYIDWLFTQKIPEPIEGGLSSSWLTGEKIMYSRRAPGNTCLSSLNSGICGSVKNPINMKKGCGGVMRVAPVGLYGYLKGYNPEDSGIIGAEAAAITHGHPLGFIPAMMLSYIIHCIMDGDEIIDAVDKARKEVKVQYRHSLYLKNLMTLVDCAIELVDEDFQDNMAIWQIGEGWTGDEALAISIYCSLKYKDNFESGIIAAVNHNGDSDSTGSITGNILGTYLGIKGVPKKYQDNLELYDIIMRIAEDMNK